jgi:hypothetical protein
VGVIGWGWLGFCSKSQIAKPTNFSGVIGRGWLGVGVTGWGWLGFCSKRADSEREREQRLRMRGVKCRGLKGRRTRDFGKWFMEKFSVNRFPYFTY